MPAWFLAWIIATFLFRNTSADETQTCAAYPERHSNNLTIEAIHYLNRHSKPFSFCASGTTLPVGSFVRSVPHPKHAAKREAIKQAVAHAWDGYASSAWGYDELAPLTKEGQDTFAENLGTTIVDSLTTLYIMGLTDRYRAARDWVATKLDFSRVGRVIVFETVIRIMGSLISMFHLTGDPMYLQKAEDLGGRLAASFETPQGLPWPICSLNETGTCYGHRSLGDSLYLAEVGSVQLEFRALAHHSEEPLLRSMRRVTERVIDFLQTANSSTVRLGEPHEALLPFSMSLSSGMFSTSLITLGAPADSYFEYLVKMWRQGGRKEPAYWVLFSRVMDSMVNVASYTSRDGVTIVRDVVPGTNGNVQFQHKMDHFACYIPGMIVLGLDGLAENEHDRRKSWELLAEQLTETCYKMYDKSPSGLSGENIRLGDRDQWMMSGGYHLRPEAVEAFYYMYKHTKKEKYRDYAWSVFQQIERHCRVESGGYSAIRTARTRHPKMENVMHSFVISETFKYIYLIFGEDDELPMDQWVFNTEAHPLLITPGLRSELESCEKHAVFDDIVKDEL